MKLRVEAGGEGQQLAGMTCSQWKLLEALEGGRLQKHGPGDICISAINPQRCEVMDASGLKPPWCVASFLNCHRK